MPALVFNPVPLYRAAQFLGLWFLCRIAGKKNNFLMTFTVFLTIIAFNLIIPYGRILFSFGFIKITEGALMTGIQRAATLEGLIMLSRLAIRHDLEIPGVFGNLISESFRVFSLITESKHRIKRKTLFADIDKLLLDLDMEKIETRESSVTKSTNAVRITSNRTKPIGYIIIIFVIILAWLPWVFILLH